MGQTCSLAYMTAAHALQGQIQAMLDQVEPLRAETADGIHDMRVASRRLRAVLGEYGKLFAKPPTRRLREHVRQVTRGLSRPRELDVTVVLLEEYRKGLHGPARYAVNHVLRAMRVLRNMESAGVAQITALVASHAFTECARAVSTSFGAPKRCYIRSAIRSTTRRHQQVVEVYTAWKSTPSNQGMHRLRIAFKKLRYACEIHRKAYGPEMEAFIGQLKNVQDGLGDWHDHCVVRTYVQQAAFGAPPRAAEGMEEFRRVVDQRIQELSEQFTQHAAAFFEPSQQESITRMLSGLAHECSWPEGANS